MMPIRKVRARPRVTSINWRSLWWLVSREAAMQTLYDDLLGGPQELAARNTISSARAEHLRAAVALAVAAQKINADYPAAYAADGELHGMGELHLAEGVELPVVPRVRRPMRSAATSERLREPP